MILRFELKKDQLRLVTVQKQTLPVFRTHGPSTSRSTSCWKSAKISVIRVIRVLKMASHSEATELLIGKVYLWLVTYQVDAQSTIKCTCKFLVFFEKNKKTAGF
jgi:hypothetical protein